MGVTATITIFTFGGQLLTYMAGASASNELISFATGYSLIRASVAVSSVLGIVSQSFCLANLDTRTPALAVLVASITNAGGDLLLSRYGVLGAAVATAAASVASSAILLKAVRRQVLDWRRKEKEETISMKSAETVDEASEKYKAAVQNASDARPIPMLSLPGRSDLIDFVKLSGPIFFVMLAKISCYGAMTIRVTDFGVLPLAAHSIMLRVFFFFACFGDAISQTAQSYLPATLYPKPQLDPLRQLLRRMLILAASIGVLSSGASLGILQQFSPWLSNNVGIVQLLQKQAPFMALALTVHPFIMMLEGFVLTSRHFRTLVTTYLVTMVVHFSTLGACTSFGGVWKTLGIFQGIRLINYATRVWPLSTKNS